ncbi:alkaline phosphatase PhoX, partial [Vibrio cholerae]|uniref:alkaline phosphatase PhoX n=1 Tax=Vibrio cholerae TaxID=666 RepID=UPI0030805374
VVEIDPHNPNSTPLKRTALGRFKHENAALVINNDGHVVVYLGYVETRIVLMPLVITRFSSNSVTLLVSIDTAFLVRTKEIIE